MNTASVLVVGAGIAGVAAARALVETDAVVSLVDRAAVAGGRMASRTLDGRPVDLGASYFTADPDSDFARVVADWTARGLAREWTDSFAIAGPDGLREVRSGPLRYAALRGLRSLVVDLAQGIDLTLHHTVERIEQRDDGVDADGVRYDRVITAMPDPQVRRLFSEDAALAARLGDSARWEPTIAVALRFASRVWPADLHGAFVSDSPDLTFIADDGDRRGDDAPVLVAHSTAALAREHLADPQGAVAPMILAVQRSLGISAEPESSYAHRWSFARPAETHGEPYLRVGDIGVAGDAWSTKSSVGAAWTSGHSLGGAILTE